MKQLSSELASRDAAQSAAITAVSDRLNRLKHSRFDRGDRESANLQSVPLPPQSASVVVEFHESRRDRAHTPPKMRSSIRLDTADYCRCRPQVIRESRTGIVVMQLVRYSCLSIITLVSYLLHCRRPTPRWRVCHRRPFLSRYRLTHQCPHRCRHCRSRTNPTRHSLPRLCRCCARCRRCCHLLLKRIRMPLLESPGPHGSSDTVESRIKTALHRDIGYQNPRISRRRRVISHAV